MDSMPVREGLFDEKDGGRLLANRCSACGRTFFPKADFCFDCLAEEMEDIVLSRQGTLYAYTIGRLPSTHFKPPYVVGLIDIPEGIRVFAPLLVSPDAPLTVGMPMQLTIDTLWEEEGKRVMGYKFIPVASQKEVV
ncbi:conserved uncharacterized protein, DUF35 [Desulfosarcina variabilis str. Montpellier]|uniref:Zn-ribbon domain-containing OB-fold protein n=1 Tax=Desulfosarcina variabilis TaxID=2300 RepID=UPI003AFA405E